MDDYSLLTRTGPGTPCGDLMRRYWQPAALSEELPPGGPPLTIRLLGEDLVFFRDDKGRPGLLALHCCHRGADLSYGRVEDGGLRCIYHGWLYDIHGNCLDQPGEPRGSNTHKKVRQLAYPCIERQGLIFAYLGPGQPPELPNFEFLKSPEEHVFVTKVFSECNYLQGNEGNVDLLHVSFLHYSDRDLKEERGANRPGVAGFLEALSPRGSAPEMERCEAEIVDVGLRVCKIRTLGTDSEYIRVGTLILPNLYAFPAGGLNWHVPIDDTHHWKYIVAFDRDKPYDKEALRRTRDEFTPPPHFKPVLNKANRYLQDRESMKAGSYSGVDKWNFPAQDLCVTEGAGPIQDRTKEHLMPSDQPLVVGRKLLEGAIQDVLEGRDPPAVVRDPAKNSFSTIVATNGVIPKSTDWKDHCRKLVAEGRGWVGRPAITNTGS
ncbi:MAG: Rieske 2Fe-2S domain-containing protein [Deltaproteobacteria bacterium]|nr:Rieske 2Fe-2S domain-containing protein [Deltaproteobacteria bacterium]